MIRRAILQIVPRVPGGLDGVGDYALNLAAKLRDKFGCITVFAVTNLSSATSIGDFEVLPLDCVQDQPGKFDHILLHYVNYGYQKRGVPFGLLSILRRMQRDSRRKLVTIFHELYASGPVLSSSFWLQPFQIHLTRSIARLSHESIVSSESFSKELQRLEPGARIHLHPTPSGLGEPMLSRDEIANRDPSRWAIVGGTMLAERSLRSFVAKISNIPESIAPRNLFVLGGNENSATRSLLANVGIKSDYRPRISAPEASEILKTCSFTWFNYFRRPDVETAVALKSSAFAAACAHAVIPVFPHRGTTIAIAGDRLPGPFFVEPDAQEIPTAEGRAKVAADTYDWYRRHVASDCLVRGIANALGFRAS
jgi:hypothetical protein